MLPLLNFCEFVLLWWLFVFCSVSDQNQGLVLARQVVYHWGTPPPRHPFYFILKWGLGKLPRLTSNLLASCFSVLSHWDCRYVHCPGLSVNNLLLVNHEAQGRWYKFPKIQILVKAQILPLEINTIKYSLWNDRFGFSFLRKCLPNTQVWINCLSTILSNKDGIPLQGR